MGLGFPIHSRFLPPEQYHLSRKSHCWCVVVGRPFDEGLNFRASVAAFEVGWARLILPSKSDIVCSVERGPPSWAADLVYRSSGVARGVVVEEKAKDKCETKLGELEQFGHYMDL